MLIGQNPQLWTKLRKMMTSRVTWSQQLPVQRKFSTPPQLTPNHHWEKLQLGGWPLQAEWLQLVQDPQGDDTKIKVRWDILSTFLMTLFTTVIKSRCYSCNSWWWATDYAFIVIRDEIEIFEIFTPKWLTPFRKGPILDLNIIWLPYFVCLTISPSHTLSLPSKIHNISLEFDKFSISISV